ncbi:Unknown protein sequence [Pseudomonas coronafaciens pv. porri]|nr:Unknown protein sequence [Pseudomonas coronafaciens pv. porri]
MVAATFSGKVVTEQQPIDLHIQKITLFLCQNSILGPLGPHQPRPRVILEIHDGPGLVIPSHQIRTPLNVVAREEFLPLSVPAGLGLVTRQSMRQVLVITGFKALFATRLFAQRMAQTDRLPDRPEVVHSPYKPAVGAPLTASIQVRLERAMQLMIVGVPRYRASIDRLQQVTQTTQTALTRLGITTIERVLGTEVAVSKSLCQGLPFAKKTTPGAKRIDLQQFSIEIQGKDTVKPDYIGLAELPGLERSLNIVKVSHATLVEHGPVQVSVKSAIRIINAAASPLAKGQQTAWVSLVEQFIEPERIMKRNAVATTPTALFPSVFRAVTGARRIAVKTGSAKNYKAAVKQREGLCAVHLCHTIRDFQQVSAIGFAYQPHFIATFDPFDLVQPHLQTSSAVEFSSAGALAAFSPGGTVASTGPAHKRSTNCSA